MTVQECITLSKQDLEEYTWNQDGLHLGHPLTPLFASYMVPAMTEGTKRSMGALKMPIRQFIGKVHQGYFYQAVISAPGDPDQVMKEHQAVIEPLMGFLSVRLQDEVDHLLWPLHQEIDGLTKTMSTPTEAIRALERLQDIYLTFWDAHFRLILPRSAVGMALENVYREAFPEGDPTDVYDFLVGIMNKSLESDRGLWILAQQAKSSPTVMDCFNLDPIYPELTAEPEAAPFLAALKDYLDTYGWRSLKSHEFFAETWIENPEYCLKMIRSYIRQDYDFDSHWAQIVEARETRVQAVAHQITNPALRETFLVCHRNALEAWPLDEDHHFYIDAMLPARSRRLVLKVANILMKMDQLSKQDDVFFLYQDEVISLLQGTSWPDQGSVIATRRKDYVSQQQMTPVPQLGKPPERSTRSDPLMIRVCGTGAPTMEGSTRSVRGFAASKGRYVGPVRVVHGPEEFSKVESGDVLVCRTTAPSWTALFAIVGGIITDSGGILSHAATVAREYGLPCVVGTQTATKTFRDGDRVLVDGSQGLAVFDE